MSEPPPVPFKAPTMFAALPLILGALGVGIALSTYFGSNAEGLPIGAAAGALALVILFSWPLRHEFWLWAAIAFFALVNAWGALSLDWSWVDTMRDGVTLLGSVMCGDALAMGAIVYGLYSLKYGIPTKVGEDSDDDLPRYQDRDLTF